MRDLLKVLRDRGAISQDEFEALHHAAKADEEEGGISKVAEREIPEAKEEEGFEARTDYTEPTAESINDNLKILRDAPRDDYEGFAVEYGDGDFIFGIGGRLELDANFFFGEDKTRLGNGVEIRRARLGVFGTMWRVWDYNLEVSFGGNQVSIADAYIRFNGFQPLPLTLGQDEVFFSIGSLTSDRWQVFQERAMIINAFVGNKLMGRRRLGVSALTHWDAWTVSGGFYGGGIGNGARQFDESWGTAGRVTFAPITVATDPSDEAATRVLHFGGSAYYRDFGHKPGLTFASYPAAHQAPSLVNTGVISGAEDILLLGGEVSAVWGSFHAQGEYIHARVGRKNGLPDPDFDGWYVQAGYFLTGDSRHYDEEEAEFERVFPEQGGWGAWEIAARYGTIDLTDSGILGGVERNFTVALNWWATSTILFRLNYIHARTDPTSIAAGVGVDEAINAVTLRAQVAF